MRGLASILLVLAAAVAVISLAGVYNAQKERNLETSSYALELERSYYLKLEFKHSVMQALARGASDGNTGGERAEEAARRLAELAGYLEKTKNAELWCGVIGEGEIEALSEKITEEKKPLKCSSCWGAEEKATFVKAFPERKTWTSYKCLSFLNVDAVEKKIGVSKGGLVSTQDAGLMAEQFSGKFVLGVSYYDEVTGIGSVALIPEGTWVSYE